jgi:ferredoxin/flavodoxin---NADP+ reductase
VARRNLEVLRAWSERTPQGRPRRLHLRFLLRLAAKQVKVAERELLLATALSRPSDRQDRQQAGTGPKGPRAEPVVLLSSPSTATK